MQKKRLTTLFKKASRFLKVPILVARMRKSINIQRPISLKKSRKMKKLMLLRHYSYGYVHAYQFSSSSSPLIHCYHRSAAKKRRCEDLYSIFAIGKCLGMIRAEREHRGCPLQELKALPCIENSMARESYHETSEIGGGDDYDDDDDDSIDERAEKFIEKFYEEIRMQRQSH